MYRHTLEMEENLKLCVAWICFLAFVHFRWLEAAFGTVCHPHHLSFTAEPPQNLSLFLLISFLTVFGF